MVSLLVEIRNMSTRTSKRTCALCGTAETGVFPLLPCRRCGKLVCNGCRINVAGAVWPLFIECRKCAKNQTSDSRQRDNGTSSWRGVSVSAFVILALIGLIAVVRSLLDPGAVMKVVNSILLGILVFVGMASALFLMMVGYVMIGVCQEEGESTQLIRWAAVLAVLGVIIGLVTPVYLELESRSALYLFLVGSILMMFGFSAFLSLFMRYGSWGISSLGLALIWALIEKSSPALFGFQITSLRAGVLLAVVFSMIHFILEFTNSTPTPITMRAGLDIPNPTRRGVALVGFLLAAISLVADLADLLKMVLGK
jgi:hypothetical protein